MTQQENLLKEAQDYVNALVSQRDFHQNECTKFMAAAFKAKRENEELIVELDKLKLESANFKSKLDRLEIEYEKLNESYSLMGTD